MTAGATMVLFGCKNEVDLDKLDSLYYPPALAGHRESHPGAKTHSHSRAWTKKSDWAQGKYSHREIGRLHLC